MHILIAGALALALDQSTKRLARARPDSLVSLAPLVCFRHVATVRSSFHRRSGRVSLLLGWGLALISALLLSASGAGLQTEIARVGVGVALGGAAGNLVDVLRRRSVTDFIDLGWWPVFNLADVGIVAGLAMAFWPLE